MAVLCIRCRAVDRATCAAPTAHAAVLSDAAHAMCDALALGVTGIRAVALSAVRFAGAAVR